MLVDRKTWITFPQRAILCYVKKQSLRFISCSCVLKGKKCVERNCIVRNFRAISAMESQKSGRRKSNEETKTIFVGLFLSYFFLIKKIYVSVQKVVCCSHQSNRLGYVSRTNQITALGYVSRTNQNVVFV